MSVVLSCCRMFVCSSVFHPCCFHWPSQDYLLQEQYASACPILSKLLLCVFVLPFDKGGTLLAKYPWTIRLWIGACARRTRPGPSFWVAVRCCRNSSATGDPDVNLIVLRRGNANTHSCSILESVAFQFFKVLLLSCSLGWSQHHTCISSCF